MTVAIIGGGLSGLSLARRLHRQGRTFTLIEARDRLGGRIFSKRDQGFDMGPAWFWPGQPRMLALTQDLGLEIFDQYAQGDLLFEDGTGPVQRGRGFASMQGSWRIAGGMAHLINNIARDLPTDALRLGDPVTNLSLADAAITITLNSGSKVTAEKVIFALPPRLVADFNFAPVLPPGTIETLRAIPTWMAGQAKAVALFDTPFWRDMGLSGDASSRIGPMVELHDASPMSGGPYALFGFIGVPPAYRKNTADLEKSIRAQLVRLFGPVAQNPMAVLVKDWATDRLTATNLDMAPLTHHPTYSLPLNLQNLWGSRLDFAGTEVAPDFGGYLEGALEGAERALNRL